ncbi:MAG: DNA recombination protein RmuC [Verrucomicrobiaceae bacterium]|jgi:DNA recombination protein RmuC|nr:DNA recombination protein RmuC [Verrucomicrobiaceae bacterium]
MSDVIQIVVLLGTVAAVALLFMILARVRQGSTDSAERVLRDELRAGRGESQEAARELREELGRGLKDGNDSLTKSLAENSKVQNAQLEGFTKKLEELSESNRRAIDRVRENLEERVKELREGNEKKLEEMRKTVDEKLHETLEKRLGESFKLVSERLENVQKGLGEMQNLASGVGDLKRVLTNVKARGTWAEYQLGDILGQTLTPEQYASNVQTRENTTERVEFAVKLPGPEEDPGSCIWLPIDSKFPTEDYQRLQAAADKADAEAVEKSLNAFLRTVRNSAREIQTKYINPPSTTDFAVLFLATEGMYAEVLRQPGMLEEIQQNHRILIAGPTTLTALLNSLRMGFRTLAIEKQASEVWQVLAAVKTEFGKFGEVLDKVKRQLDTASRSIEQTGTRTRAMERKLRSVESLPDDKATELLGLDELDPAEGEEGAS